MKNNTLSQMGSIGLVCFMTGGCGTDQSTQNELVESKQDTQILLPEKRKQIEPQTVTQITLDSDIEPQQISLESSLAEAKEFNTQNRALLKLQDNLAEIKNPTHNHEVNSLKESLENSYARLAAKKADVCPKLLQKKVDSNLIIRRGDVMKTNFCDYYLYPSPGQKIMVNNDSKNIKSLLVSPVEYDFANGPYQAISADKHVIRLVYDGNKNQLQKVSYNLMVQFADS